MAFHDGTPRAAYKAPPYGLQLVFIRISTDVLAMSEHVVSHTYPDTIWRWAGVRYLSQRPLGHATIFFVLGLWVSGHQPTRRNFSRAANVSSRLTRTVQC